MTTFKLTWRNWCRL